MTIGFFVALLVFNYCLCNCLLLVLAIRFHDILCICAVLLEEELIVLFIWQLCYCTCIRSSDRAEEREQDTVTQADLEHFLHLLEGKDGVMDWQSFMERSTPNMQYKAWRHDPEVQFSSHFNCLCIVI